MNNSEQQAPLKGEGGPTVKTLQAHEREFKKVLACYCVLNLKLKCFEIKKTNEQSEAMPSPMVLLGVCILMKYNLGFTACLHSMAALITLGSNTWECCDLI